MILQALSDYYSRVAEGDDSEIADFGYSRQKIAFEVLIEPDGTLVDIHDIREDRDGRKTPKSLVMPGGAKPSGSGLNPTLFWDNPAYMLGFNAEGKKPERTQKSFEAFRQLHMDHEKQIDDPQFSAVCRFLDKWNPADAAKFEFLSEMTGFGTFRLRGETRFVHESAAVTRFWLTQLQNQPSDSPIGQCLVAGTVGPLARLHEPKIKGVWGAQSMGAAIVSFNLDAFESYGKEQSFNAPVGETAAFRYCTALNHLLREQSPQRVQIGDASTVFWTDKPSPIEDIFGPLVAPPFEDDALRERMNVVLVQIARGQYPRELGAPETRFFVLGLSPNASRISIRFWHQSTLGDLVANLHKHFDNLEIARSDRDIDFPSFRQILNETGRRLKEKVEDIPPLLSGALMRSILLGTRYPDLLYMSVLRRMRADRRIGHIRAAVLKACLVRNFDKEVSVGLDENRPEPAYHLGRLFAALEKAQEDALPGLNDTIKDRFFGAASASPGAVFPRLIRLSQHHLGKLDRGHRIGHERRIQSICKRLDGFSKQLNLPEQGLFAIGYYHQRLDIFTKKTSDEPKSEELANAESL